MKIYVHREHKLEADAIEVEPTTTVAEAIDVGADDEVVVLLEDQDEAIELAASLEDAGIGDRAHVFVGRRKRVHAEVTFNADSIKREFSASTRVGRVFRWATGKHGHDLSQADAAEHILSLCADGSVPADDVHLGALDDATPGEVCFMLIPKQRFEG